MRRYRLFPLLLLLIPGSLRGQYPSYNVPDDPVFVYLGVAPKNVATVGAPAQLVAALAQGIDEHGQAVAGVAVSFVPWSPRRFPLGLDEIRNPWKYAALRTQISLGTVRAAGETGSTDLGIGFRTLLFDAGDYRRDREWFGALGSGASKSCSKAPTEPIRGFESGTTPRQLTPGGGYDPDTLYLRAFPTYPDAATADECREKYAARRITQWQKEHWNASQIGIGFATGPRFVGSSLDDARWVGASTWVTGAKSLRGWGQIVGQMRYDFRNAAADTLQDQQAVAAGGRFLVGGAAMNGFAELLYARPLHPRNGEPAHDVGWSLGLEFQVAEKLWLSGGFGEIYDGLVKKGDRTVMLFNVRFAATQAARLTPPPAE